MLAISDLSECGIVGAMFDFVLRHKYSLSTAFLVCGVTFSLIAFEAPLAVPKVEIAIQPQPIEQDGRISKMWASPPPPRPPFRVVVTGNVSPIPINPLATSTIDITISNLSIDHITDVQGLLLKGPDDPYVDAKEIFEKANLHLNDGSLSLVLDVPGANVAPKLNKLLGSGVHFLVRGTDNKDGDFIGRFSFDGRPQDMDYVFEGQSVSLHVAEYHSTRDTVSWYFTLLGPGFTATGILGILFGWLLPKPGGNKEDDHADDNERSAKKNKMPKKKKRR
jgi:hypothetical protein